MKIAVVILNWNGKQLLEQFLPSVIEHSSNADIYIADNASTDTSITFVKSTYPSIKIISNSENGGYARGYNIALKQVNADVFCLLNSDVEVTHNWLEPVSDLFNKESNTAIIQPKILDYKNKSFFEYAGAGGGFIDKYGYPFCRGRIFDSVEKDSGQYNDVATIFWASGACFFIRKEVFKELNGFDETFFAHMEEIDLCWRTQNRGYDVRYQSSSVVYHVGGATLHSSNPKKTYLNFRNSLYTLTKNSAGVLLPKLLTRLCLDGIAGVKFLFSLKPLHTLAIVRAHFHYYYRLSRLLEQRDQPNKIENYWYKKSIVWSYFVNKKRHFDSL